MSSSAVHSLATQVRFHLAGLEVELCCADPWLHSMTGAFAGLPARRSGPADLVLELTLGDDREVIDGPSSSFPEFEARTGETTLELNRADASGRFDLDGERFRGAFHIARNANALEGVLRMGVALTLPLRGALLLHASTVEWPGGWRVFFGPSGAGKSTISTFLDRVGGAAKVGDEMVILRRSGAGFDAVIPPFLGKATAFGKTGVVRGLYSLVQASSHASQSLPRSIAVGRLSGCVVGYAGIPAVGNALLHVIDALSAEVPVRELQFSLDDAEALTQVLEVT